MSNTADNTSGRKVEPGQATPELRIEDLPAGGATEEQADALRAGADDGCIPRPILTHPTLDAASPYPPIRR